MVYQAYFAEASEVAVVAFASEIVAGACFEEYHHWEGPWPSVEAVGRGWVRLAFGAEGAESLAGLVVEALLSASALAWYFGSSSSVAHALVVLEPEPEPEPELAAGLIAVVQLGFDSAAPSIVPTYRPPHVYIQPRGSGMLKSCNPNVLEFLPCR